MTTRSTHRSSVPGSRRCCAERRSVSGVPPKELSALLGAVEEYFTRYGWPKKGSKILAALSGGPDSVTMLHVLSELARDRQWNIASAHVNYGLRGKESDQDETFCRDMCRRMGIRFHCSRRSAVRHRGGVNVQAWARELRYRFLGRIADRDGYDWIAVGHHLGDRAETVAAAVLDAAGTFALSGIPPVRGRIIRPLFDCSPEAIREFLHVSGIPFRLDRSNATMTYQRNRIRQQVIPAWTNDNPSIVRGLARLGEQLWRQQTFLERQAARQLQKAVMEESTRGVTLDAARLSRSDRSLDPFFLRDLIARLGLTLVPTASTVERFFQLRQRRGSGRVEQGEFIVERSKGQIAATTRFRSRTGSHIAAQTKADPAGGTPQWEIKTEIVEDASREQFDDRRHAFLDLDRVRPPLKLRSVQAGDRYRPLGLDGTKKLLDLLADHKVPVFQRRQSPVLIDREGILWPVGQPIADRAKITRKTRRILRVAVQTL